MSESQLHNDTSGQADELSAAMDELPILTDEQRELASKIQEPLQYVFAAISVPLALCNIIIFSRRDMRSPSAIYVISINAGQLWYVVTYLIHDVTVALYVQPLKHYAFSFYAFYVTYYAGILVARRGSYAVLVPSSVERLYAVLRPLHLKNFFLSKRPGTVVLCIYALSAILHIYWLTKSTVEPVMDRTGAIVYRAVPTNLYIEQQAINDTFSLAAKFILTYTSLASQFVLNGLTVWALRRHNTAHQHVQSSADDDAKRQQERQLTITLLGGSASYLLFSLPSALFNVYVNFFNGTRYQNLNKVVGEFCANMNILGCGIDFFCYLALSSKYRKTMRRMFCRQKESVSGGSEDNVTDVASITDTRSSNLSG